MSRHATPSNIGAELRRARRAAGLTQEEVARRAPCSVSYVRLLEAGYRPGSGDTYDAVARIVGFPSTSNAAEGNRGVATRARSADPGGHAMSGALLNAEQAAELLNVPKSWVLAEARADRIPHMRFGRYVRFDADALRAWCAERARGPRQASP